MSRPAIHERWVCGRATIYLDNNVWIELTEARGKDALECRRLGQQLVEDGLAIFPVTAAAVEEFFDQPDEARPQRQARLMDQLSRGVCLRAAQCVWDHEARSALDVVPGVAVSLPDHREMFTHVAEYLSAGEIVFQDEWSEEHINTFMVLLREDLPNRGVEWLLDHLPRGEMRRGHQEASARYVEELSERTADSNGYDTTLTSEAPRRLAAFELESGRRTWDVSLEASGNSTCYARISAGCT